MNVYDQVHKIRTTVSEKYIRNKDEYCGAASSSGRSNSLFKDYQNLHSWLNQLILIFKSMTIKQLLIQHWL